MTTLALADRFWAKVERVDNPGGCWIWHGALNRHGYGVLAMSRSHQPRNMLAHRVAWVILHGPIPDGMLCLHRCDVPACVNSETHLFLGTQSDNMTDAARKGRNAMQRWPDRHPRGAGSSCPHGHPYSEANLYVTTRGGRRCRACTLARNRESHSRRTAVACLSSGGQFAEVGAVFELAAEFEAWVLR